MDFLQKVIWACNMGFRRKAEFFFFFFLLLLQLCFSGLWIMTTYTLKTLRGSNIYCLLSLNILPQLVKPLGSLQLFLSVAFFQGVKFILSYEIPRRHSIKYSMSQSSIMTKSGGSKHCVMKWKLWGLGNLLETEVCKIFQNHVSG